MSQYEILAGIDVGSAYTKLSCVRTKTDAAGIVYEEKTPIGSLLVPTKGFIQGVVKNEKVFSAHIEHVLNLFTKKTGLHIKDVRVSANHPFINSVYERLEEVRDIQGTITADLLFYAQAKAAENLKRKNPNAEVLPPTLIALTVDFKKVNPQFAVGTIAKRQIIFEYTSVVYPRNNFRHLEQIIDRHTSITRIIPSSISLSTCLSHDEQKVGTVILDIGATTTTVMIWKHEALIFLRVLPIGGAYITEQIALQKKISLEEAEAIKCAAYAEHSNVDASIQQLIEKTFGTIVGMVKEVLMSYDSELLFPGGVLITGGTSSLPFATQHLKKGLGLFVRHASLPGENYSKPNVPKYTQAVVSGLLHVTDERLQTIVTSSFYERLRTALHSATVAIRYFFK